MSTPTVTIGPAAPTEFERIAELTVGVYTAEDLAPPGYVPALADVPGRAGRSELLVERPARGGWCCRPACG